MKLSEQILTQLNEETFDSAKKLILDTLKEAGWEIRLTSPSNKPMKVPWASPKSGGDKLWFKKEAIWTGDSKPLGSSGYNHKEVADMIRKNKDKALSELEKWVR